MNELITQETYSVPVVAKKLGISPLTVRTYIKKGIVDGHKNPINKRYRVTQKGLNQLLEAFGMNLDS